MESSANFSWGKFSFSTYFFPRKKMANNLLISSIFMFTDGERLGKKKEIWRANNWLRFSRFVIAKTMKSIFVGISHNKLPIFIDMPNKSKIDITKRIWKVNGTVSWETDGKTIFLEKKKGRRLRQCFGQTWQLSFIQL